jgi:hypothetical protein
MKKTHSRKLTEGVTSCANYYQDKNGDPLCRVDCANHKKYGEPPICEYAGEYEDDAAGCQCYSGLRESKKSRADHLIEKVLGEVTDLFPKYPLVCPHCRADLMDVGVMVSGYANTSLNDEGYQLKPTQYEWEQDDSEPIKCSDCGRVLDPIE